MVPWIALSARPGVRDLRKTLPASMGLWGLTALRKDPGHHSGGLVGWLNGPNLECYQSPSSHMVPWDTPEARPGVIDLRETLLSNMGVVWASCSSVTLIERLME